MNLRCHTCNSQYEFDPLRFRCDCEAPLEIEGAPSFDPNQVDRDNLTLWRYRHAMPLPQGAKRVTLGEGWTPLVETIWEGISVHLKCEPLNPTGSFKDRGTTLLVSALAEAGVELVVEDSSGNAGASLAAYAARASIAAEIYVPAHASPVKQAQIAAYGARLVQVPGPRTATAQKVLEVAQAGAVYASHVYHPLVHHGLKTAAFELYEQIGAPDAVVLPVGHGSLLLGLALGFDELLRAGCIARRPRLFGIQAVACAPLASAWEQGSADAPQVQEGETVAEGVRIAAPVRGREILHQVRASGGGIVSVADAETISAQKNLARQGFYVEPTSALAVAGLAQLREQLEGRVVIILTGSGFKTPSH